MSLQLSSPAFSSGQTIPVKYTCEGQDLSPPLEWTDYLQKQKASANRRRPRCTRPRCTENDLGTLDSL